MSGENYVNTASVATTSSPVATSDPEVIPLSNYSGFPTAPFWAELERGTALAEIVRVTNVAGSNVTCARGQGGTALTSHGAGATFEHVIPADMPNRFEAHSAATAAHGASGAVVGTTGSQTVQDKTFRGAHVSTQSDALPAGVTSSFLSNADNSSARDGFVHNNTAGSAARAAFLLTQSGTDRFRVANTGGVTINPSTGTALTVTGNETVSGTLAVTGALSANGGTSTSGLTVTTSGIVVSGGAIVSGNAQFNNNVSATGTLHSNGSIDTDTNLTVDGTSTLTGAVTAGNGVAVTGAVTASTTMAATQGISAWGGSRAVLSVASTAAVTTPTTGDVVWDRSVKLWKEWTGAAWATIDRPYAQMRQTVSQSVPHATYTALTFTTEDFDNVAGHSTVSNTSRYVCQTGFDGVYELSGQFNCATNVTGSRTTRWSKNGAVLPASQSPGFDASATSLALARTILVRLVATDYVELEGYQSSGGSLSTNVTAEFQSSMTVKWYAP